MKKIMMLSLGAAVVFTTFGVATAQSGKSEIETIAEKDVPAPVALRMRCKTPAGNVTRTGIAGGYVFVQNCNKGSEAENRLVFATDRDGTGARLLLFHRPEGRRVSALATAAVADNEISGSVGRLTRRICRAEGRWQMEGKQPSPSLVYWRQTADCDGKTGWQVMVNRKPAR